MLCDLSAANLIIFLFELVEEIFNVNLYYMLMDKVMLMNDGVVLCWVGDLRFTFVEQFLQVF